MFLLRREGLGSAATGLTPFVVAAGRPILIRPSAAADLQDVSQTHVTTGRRPQMTDNKRMTAAELRLQQEEREAHAQRQRTEALQRQRTESEAREQAKLREQIDNIIATWYDKVLAASKLDGVRFVVLAQVIDAGTVRRNLEEVISSVSRDGYKCEIRSLSDAPTRPAAPPSPIAGDKEGHVSDGTEIGWKPAGLPRIGSNGSVLWLVARW